MKLPNPFVDFEPEFTGPGSASADLVSRKKLRGGSRRMRWSVSGGVKWPDGTHVKGRIITEVYVDDRGRAVAQRTTFKPFAGQTDASENAIPTETVVLSKDDHVETYSTKVVEALRRGNWSASKDGEEAPDASWAAPSVKGRGGRTAERAAAATANARGSGSANMNTVPPLKPLEEPHFQEVKTPLKDDTDGGTLGSFGGGGVERIKSSFRVFVGGIKMSIPAYPETPAEDKWCLKVYFDGRPPVWVDWDMDSAQPSDAEIYDPSYTFGDIHVLRVP